MSDAIQLQQSLQNEINFIVLLPPEIWDIILGNLKDPHDILVCCEVCDVWESLLQNKIVSSYFQLILPKVVPYMDASDYLNCSAVSKTWNTLVDTSLQKARKATIYWSLDELDPEPFPSLTVHGAFEMERILTEKEAWAHQFDNPVAYSHIIVRKFHQEELSDEQFELFCETLQKFLNRFGKYIYQLELFSLEYSTLRMFRMIEICFNQTPNLHSYLCDFGTDLVEHLIVDDDGQVDDFLTASPLPCSTVRKLGLENVPWKVVDVMIERYDNQCEYLYY